LISNLDLSSSTKLWTVNLLFQTTLLRYYLYTNQLTYLECTELLFCKVLTFQNNHKIVHLSSKSTVEHFYYFKRMQGQTWWLTPVILSTHKVEIGRIMVQVWCHPGQKVSKNPFQSIGHAWQHVPMISAMQQTIGKRIPVSGNPVRKHEILFTK
jgi:hypothetical protein